MFLRILMLFVAGIGTTQKVIDLTSEPLPNPNWKIVKTTSGGQIGTTDSGNRIALGLELQHPSLVGGSIAFSLVITNQTSKTIELPIGKNLTPLAGKPGVITFTSLLIQVKSTSDGSLAARSVELYGSDLIPGSLYKLQSGASVILRLQTTIQHQRFLSEVQAGTSAFEVQLSPQADGYLRYDKFIPSFTAASASQVLPSINH